MTFVPQPYEQFVDDLLTGLTGGFVREEHRFESAAEPYPLSSDSVVPDSVRVVGQLGEAFRVFSRGVDYEVDEAKAEVLWLESGAMPDERSLFYVNYYPAEAAGRLTERNPGSVNRTMCEAFSRPFAVLHRQMELVYRSAFVEFATDRDLDHLARLVDLTRRDQRYAIGEVLLKRSTPATATIVVPAGTLVSTAAGRTFETVEERRLRRGQLSVAAPIRARDPGSEGIVEAGAITLLNEPLFGIESLANEEATHVEAARETDRQFRLRIKGAFARAGGATRHAILRGLIEDVPAVTDANVRLVEHVDRPGVVELQFGMANVDEATRAMIDEAILRHRPAGVRVIHNLGSPPPDTEVARASNWTGSGSTAPATADGTAPESVALPDDLARPGGVLPLRFEVLYRLAGEMPGAARREEIEDEIRDAVAGYVDELAMDSDVVHAKLLGRIVAPDDVADATLRLGIAGREELNAKNLSSSGRKVTIEDIRADVFVGPMTEFVSVDLVLGVQARAGTGGDPGDPGRWESHVRDELAADVAASGGAGITAARLADVIGRALEAGPFRLADDALFIEATFGDSGRVLTDPPVIDVEPHHRVSFRRVALTVASPLDE